MLKSLPQQLSKLLYRVLKLPKQKLVELSKILPELPKLLPELSKILPELPKILPELSKILPELLQDSDLIKKQDTVILSDINPLLKVIGDNIEKINAYIDAQDNIKT
jgi:hypothetical protein